MSVAGRERREKSLVPTVERFSYELEMKAREQNRNNKRTEMSDLIGLSNGQTNAPGFSLVKRMLR